MHTVGPLLIESPQAKKVSTLGPRRFVLGPNEILKEQLSFCRHYLSSLVLVDLMVSASCEISIQILAIQYKRSSIIMGPTVVIMKAASTDNCM